MPMIVSKGAASAQGFGFALSAGGADACAGIFTTSYGNAARQKYIFACNSNASATAICSGSNYNASAGNKTRIITALGFAQSSSSASSVRRKYLWVCNTDTAATNQ